MKKLLTGSLLLTLILSASAQHYEANWESLDRRPIPEWYKDAKFGIFIHWGVYSVPGWSPKGSYAEWYQYGLQTNDTARQNFHRKKFGNLSYYQLADQFRAELFNPDEWAHIFEASGARYIVLTSKHHDGFCLWPSATADKTWGFPWNAEEVGPHRDLLGDLFKAVRKTKVHAGMYYSLYEWFNPLWKADHKKFAQEHTWPQMKDLINTYQPDVFWTDGDWEAPAETWGSQQFLAWLYNESPVKDKVVVNDRWGSGVRFKHGGIYTPEYQPNLHFDNHYWEESRGMGFSYGYNRAEDSWDYNSAQSLVLQLVDKVSRGGNFLLDIGPDAHGKIPPIMEERLLDIGKWLGANGEAIYNTVKWQRSSQWSEGRTDYQPKNGGGDLLLKLTIDPDPGYAVKEAFFTYNPAQNNLYAILPRYPSSLQMRLKGIHPPAGTKLSLLETGQELTWEQEGEDLLVNFPAYDPNKISHTEAYVVKIAGYGRFTPAPAIDISYAQKNLKPVISLSGPAGAELHFTLDGSQPDASSPLYNAPLSPATPVEIKVIALQAGAMPSQTVSAHTDLYQWQEASRHGRLQAGLKYEAFRLNEPETVAAFSKGQQVDNGLATAIGLQQAPQKENFGLRFLGYLKVPESGLYHFILSSDDGSVLWVDGKKFIDADGLHGSGDFKGTLALKKGYHTIQIAYIQATGGSELKLRMGREGEEPKEIPAGNLFH